MLWLFNSFSCSKSLESTAHVDNCCKRLIIEFKLLKYVILILSFFIFLDECAQQNPSIHDVNKLIKTACKNYHYGEILHLSLVSFNPNGLPW